MPARFASPLAATAALAFGVVTAGSLPARADVARDPTVLGTYQAGFGEYKLAAAVDASVTSAAKTELWARVWYPKGSTGKRPLVVMLHGEHGTCRRSDGGNWNIDDNALYSSTGKCPTGYTVTPNHWGYDYIARRLATQGYVTISINANLGVNQMPEVTSENDPGNILRRGRLMLRHVQQVGKWAASGGTPTGVGFDFKGRIDFNKMVFFGHSRGGDAIFAADRLLRETGSPWPARLPADARIRGLAAIAPTDRQRVQTAVPTGSNVAVLLPMCDADVIRLQGVGFVDRSIVQVKTSGYKVTYGVWGADHNAYNTEWHTSDTFNFGTSANGTHECPGQTKLFPARGTSTTQQATGLVFATAVVRSSVENGVFTQVFDPGYQLPTSNGTARVDRYYKPGLVPTAQAALLTRFDVVKTGDCAHKIGTSANAVSSCGKIPEHWRGTQWIARFRWGPPAGTAGTAFYLAMRLNGGTPADLRAMRALELRVGPDCNLTGNTSTNPDVDYRCNARSSQSSGDGPQDVYVILQDTKGAYSNYVPLASYLPKRQAIGITAKPSPLPYETFYHSIMSSARIPLSAFGTGVDLSSIGHVWIAKYAASSGGLFIGDVWASSATAKVAPLPVSTTAAAPALPLPNPATLVPGAVEETEMPDRVSVATEAAPVSAGDRLVAVRGAGEGGEPVWREIEVSTRTPMIAGGAGFVVKIGGVPVETRHVGTGFEADGRTTRMRFLVPASAFVGATERTGISVHGGGERGFGEIGSIAN